MKKNIEYEWNNSAITHILAFEGDSQVYWFEGNFTDYEENRKKRLGDEEPKRIKYKKLMINTIYLRLFIKRKSEKRFH